MKAIDTNILARFFIDDPDDEQARNQQIHAIRILSQPVFVPITVILEFEWVMRGFYKLDRQTIYTVYQTLLGFQHVNIENKDSLIRTLDLYLKGLDFADSLHIVSSIEYQPFITFDQKCFKKSKDTGLTVELVK